MSESNRQRFSNDLYGIMGQPIRSTNMGRVHIRMGAAYIKEHGGTAFYGDNPGEYYHPEFSKDQSKDKH